MRVLMVPQGVVAPLDDPRQIDRVVAAVGPEDEVIVARDAAAQLREVATAEVLFGDLSPELVDAGHLLRWVQYVGAGVDRVAPFVRDRPEIALTGVRGLVGPQLAEHAFALLLAVTRGVAQAASTPGWEHRLRIRSTQRELAGSTMLVVGLGGAGREVAVRARAFGMRVIAVDPFAVDDGLVDELVGPETLDRVVGEADAVVLTLPLTQATRDMFDARRIGLMRRGAVLINVSRGELVDEDALLAAVREGRLGGAGLDVLRREPPGPDHAVWSEPRVVVTPHIAGGSPRRADLVIDLFCENLRRFREGSPLLGRYDDARGF